MGKCYSFLYNNEKNINDNEHLLYTYNNDSIDLYQEPDQEQDMFYSAFNDNDNETSNSDKQDKINLALNTKIEILEQNTQENIKILSKDIHHIYDKLNAYMSNHQLSSK